VGPVRPALPGAAERGDRGAAAPANGRTCAASPPIPACSGKTAGRYRLNRGGDRQATSALWPIVIVTMSSHPATRADADRPSEERLSEKEIIRCLKRYVAREVYRQLRDGA